jgi:hypothetical protein
MNARQRTIFGKLDSAFEGERRNALELLIKDGFAFRKEFDALESAVTEAQQALGYCEGKLAAYRVANVGARLQNKTLRGMVWGKSKFAGLSRRQKLALVAGVVAVVVGYQWLPQEGISGLFSAAAAQEREAVEQRGGQLVRAAIWGPGYSKPFLFKVSDLPYWGLFLGDSDSDGYTDGNARAVVVRCLKFYAVPASVKADGAYVAPEPFGGWFGRLSWPSVGRPFCKNAGPIKDASK